MNSFNKISLSIFNLVIEAIILFLKNKIELIDMQNPNLPIRKSNIKIKKNQ
jgi:hypothetical protein